MTTLSPWACSCALTSLPTPYMVPCASQNSASSQRSDFLSISSTVNGASPSLHLLGSRVIQRFAKTVCGEFARVFAQRERERERERESQRETEPQRARESHTATETETDLARAIEQSVLAGTARPEHQEQRAHRLLRALQYCSARARVSTGSPRFGPKASTLHASRAWLVARCFPRLCSWALRHSTPGYTRVTRACESTVTGTTVAELPHCSTAAAQGREALQFARGLWLQRHSCPRNQNLDLRFH